MLPKNKFCGEIVTPFLCFRGQNISSKELNVFQKSYFDHCRCSVQSQNRQENQACLKRITNFGRITSLVTVSSLLRITSLCSFRRVSSSSLILNCCCLPAWAGYSTLAWACLLKVKLICCWSVGGDTVPLSQGRVRVLDGNDDWQPSLPPEISHFKQPFPNTRKVFFLHLPLWVSRLFWQKLEGRFHIAMVMLFWGLIHRYWAPSC